MVNILCHHHTHCACVTPKHLVQYSGIRRSILSVCPAGLLQATSRPFSTHTTACCSPHISKMFCFSSWTSHERKFFHFSTSSLPQQRWHWQFLWCSCRWRLKDQTIFLGKQFSLFSPQIDLFRECHEARSNGLVQLFLTHRIRKHIWEPWFQLLKKNQPRPLNEIFQFLSIRLFLFDFFHRFLLKLSASRKNRPISYYKKKKDKFCSEIHYLINILKVFLRWRGFQQCIVAVSSSRQQELLCKSIFKWHQLHSSLINKDVYIDSSTNNLHSILQSLH